jgi:hypothetical protein
MGVSIMIRRVISLSIISMVALNAVVAAAQETAPVTRAEFKQAIDELKQQIGSLKTPPAAPEAAPLAPAASASPLGGSREAELAQRVTDLEKQVAELKQGHQALVDIAKEQNTKLGEIAMERISPDGAKRYVPNIQAIRDDQDARHMLVDTVAQGITRARGTLVIHNQMSTGQTLLINGTTPVTVAAGSDQTVDVPSGTATTELAGEGVKSWAVGAPNYTQDIIIAPARPKSTSLVTWQDPLTGIWYTSLQ